MCCGAVLQRVQLHLAAALERAETVGTERAARPNQSCFAGNFTGGLQHRGMQR
jgi:hypothetical protein